MRGREPNARDIYRDNRANVVDYHVSRSLRSCWNTSCVDAAKRFKDRSSAAVDCALYEDHKVSVAYYLFIY